MTPNNTHYDTLQVYFDFLEDNNVNTQELRESLLESKTGYTWVYLPKNSSVGGCINEETVDIVGSVSGNFIIVCSELGCFYDRNIGGSVGGSHFEIYYPSAVGTPSDDNYVGSEIFAVANTIHLE